MTAALLGVLALAAFLALSTPGDARRRFRAALVSPRGVPAGFPATGGRVRGWQRRSVPTVSMTLLVQQMAALLRGGRTPARLWDELWVLHVGAPTASWPGEQSPGRNSALAPGQVRVLAAARAAAMRGSPVGPALRSAGASVASGAGGLKAGNTRTGEGMRARRVWFQLAACFDVAEASGCPLADVLTRFAAQLEAEDDADDARQTALAGPRATVRLLSWLPFLGLGLGWLLGVDPVGVLLGSPWGVAALTAGLGLSAAGRFWSARLVRAAEGPQP